MIRVGVVALVWMLASVAFAQDCVEDDDLVRAASELLLRGGTPPPERVRAAAREAGSQLPSVSALVTGEDPARRRAFVARLRRQGHAPVRCGLARSEGRVLLVAGPAAGEIWLAERGDVRVDLARGWTDPRLFARDARGRTWQGPVERGRAQLPSDLDPPFELQLVARGPDGPRPVAEHRVGEASSTQSSDAPAPVRLSTLRGVRELRDNRLLGRVADRHAAQICRSGRVAHVSENGDPRERLAREGIRARHVGETASRAASEREAFDAMLESPSHRAALEDRRFTDVGHGRATDSSGRTCLVVLLAAWPRAVPYR